MSTSELCQLAASDGLHSTTQTFDAIWQEILWARDKIFTFQDPPFMCLKYSVQKIAPIVTKNYLLLEQNPLYSIS